MRASESRAAFCLMARIAAAATVLAAGLPAVRVGNSTALRTAAAGLATTRRETSTPGVFFATTFPPATLLAEAGFTLFPETDFACARAEALRLAPFTRASADLALRAALFFAARIWLLARGVARVVEVFFLAADFATAGLTAWPLAAVLVFVFCLELLAACFLAASARAAAIRLALSATACFDVFALGVPGCLAWAVLFACFVLDDFMVFLTDAIKSALLFPVPLWRRDGFLTASKRAAVRKL